MQQLQYPSMKVVTSEPQYLRTTFRKLSISKTQNKQQWCLLGCSVGFCPLFYTWKVGEIPLVMRQILACNKTWEFHGKSLDLILQTIFGFQTCIQQVHLVNIEGPVWYTIYHHCLLQKRAEQGPLWISINQPMVAFCFLTCLIQVCYPKTASCSQVLGGNPAHHWAIVPQKVGRVLKNPIFHLNSWNQDEPQNRWFQMGPWMWWLQYHFEMTIGTLCFKITK